MKHSIGRHGLRPNVTPRLLYVHPVQALQQKLNMAVSTMAKVVAPWKIVPCWDRLLSYQRPEGR